jgi:MazG family protein
MDLTIDEHGAPLFSAAKTESVKQRFFELVCIMARLRKGCPWDRQQTPASLKKYILEEAYEVLETIEAEDWPGLREELGDFLFQVMFQSEIQAEEGRFDIEDVLTGIVKKMVHRHPHVFGDEKLSAEEVALNWDRLKQAEKGPRQSLFDGFTRGLPALLESYKIGKKAAKAGFDWPEPLRVLDKVEEEIGEIRQAVAAGEPDQIREELGDLMFAVSNLVRKFGCEPEETLRAANRKFLDRFALMEKIAAERGLAFETLDLDRQETLWEEAKERMKRSST